MYESSIIYSSVVEAAKYPCAILIIVQNLCLFEMRGHRLWIVHVNPRDCDRFFKEAKLLNE